MGKTLLIGYKTFSEVATRIFSFLVVVVAARLLNRQEFGLFSLAWTAGWLVSVATDFGLQLLLAREVARFPAQAWKILRFILPVRIGLSIAALAVLLIIFRFTGSPFWSFPFLALIATQVAVSVLEFFNYFYRGLDRSDLESSLNLLHRGLAVTLVAVVLWIYPALTLLAAALGLATVLALAASGWFCWKLNRRELDASRAARLRRAPLQWQEESSLGILRKVSPIGIGIVLSALYFRVDLFLIEWWKGTEAVALYNAVFRLLESTRLLPAAVLAVMFPDLCRDHSGKTLGRTCLGLLGAALLAATLLMGFSDFVVSFFYGRDFRQAVPVFRILLLALPLLFVNFALTHQLMAWNLQHFYALVCAGALLCNLGLNWFLIPRLSIAGAAWSTIGTEVFVTLGCLFVLSRKGAEAAITEAVPQSLPTGSLN